ncbi:MAG: prepilin peptidase, partial [Christensenella sp.]
MFEFNFFWPFALIFGLIIGSFLNVCICRIPVGESIVRGGSRCPSCAHALKPLELVPILSYVFLRGKCRHCGEKISAQYPI